MRHGKGFSEQIMIKCPCCGWKFQGRWAGDNQLALPFITGRYTDFLPVTSDHAFLLDKIEACEKCGFAWEAGEFEEQNLTAEVREKIISARPSIENNRSPQGKYRLYAEVLKLLNAPIMDIAGAYLHASWACAIEGDVDGEINNRKDAIKFFVSALNNRKVSGSDVARYTYLVGELYRRIGDRQNARRWFNRVWSVVADKEEEAWILDLANKQKGEYPEDKLSEEVLCGFRDGGKHYLKLKRHNDLIRTIRQSFQRYPGIVESIKKERINYLAKKEDATRIIAFLSDQNGIMIGLTRNFLDTEEEFNLLVDQLKKEEDTRERIVKIRARLGLKTDLATIATLPKQEFLKIRPHEGGINILIRDEIAQDEIYSVLKKIQHYLLYKTLVCQRCNSKRVAEIVYGLLRYDEELKRDIDAGKIHTGGCCVRSPRWHCSDCGAEW